MQVRHAESFSQDLMPLTYPEAGGQGLQQSTIRRDLDPELAASNFSNRLRATAPNAHAGGNRLLSESYLQSSQASRGLRRSQASDGNTSQRRSSNSRSNKKRLSSSRRRRKQREEAEVTTQSYELFADRHLRKLADGSAAQKVLVNTKYELTAENTSKLWSKFEQDLLGKANPISSNAAAHQPLKANDLFDQGSRFAAQATFAPHDPDMTEPEVDGSEALQHSSSYILHSYLPLRQNRISPLRKSKGADEASSPSPAVANETPGGQAGATQEDLDKNQQVQLQRELEQSPKLNSENLLTEPIYSNRLLGVNNQRVQPKSTDFVEPPARDEGQYINNNRLLSSTDLLEQEVAEEQARLQAQVARVNSIAYQEVPLMPDQIPLSSQIRLYNEQLKVKSEEKQLSTLMTFSQSKQNLLQRQAKQSPTKMSSLSRSPLREKSSPNSNLLLKYFAMKNEQKTELYDNYMQRSQSPQGSAKIMPRRASASPLTSNRNLSYGQANELIQRELGGSPLRLVKRKSPYRASLDSSQTKRRLTMNVQGRLVAPQAAAATAGYCSTTTASMIRSIHNSQSRRDNLSGSQHSLRCRNKSIGSGCARECCNIKKVQFDLSNNIAPMSNLTAHHYQLNQGQPKKRKSSTSKTSRQGSKNGTGASKKASSTATQLHPKLSKMAGATGNAAGSKQKSSVAAIAQSATSPNLAEDRPRQLPNDTSSPSQKASQKFFFRKQVQSIDNRKNSLGAIGGGRRRSTNATGGAPRQLKQSTTPVDTMSRQLIMARRNSQHKENCQQSSNFSLRVLEKQQAQQQQPWEETDYKRMLVQMVHNFKRRSRSRGRHQMTTQNHSQLNITQVATSTLNQTELELAAQPNLLNQTVCKAMKKEKSLSELHQGSDQSNFQKNRLRKQVIAILSEVLDSRQAQVKKQLARKLSQTAAANSGSGMHQPQVVVPPAKPMTLQQQILKLTASEKLMQRLPGEDQLRSVSAYLLLLSYFQQGEYERVLRYLDLNSVDNNQNNMTRDVLDRVCVQERVKRRLASNCLHILSLKAECHLLTGQFDKGVTTFNQVCHLYNYWDFQTRKGQDPSLEDQELGIEEQHLMRKLNSSALEFGVDDYIKARAGLAECLMNCDKPSEAIQKFEGVKRKIESEVIFDKPILFINVCNQLGNCYLRIGSLQAAKENFEQSLRLIQKVEKTSDKISDTIIAKIYLNLGIIAEQMNSYENALYLHEKCLEYKMKSLHGAPSMNDEQIMSQFVLLANTSQKLEMHDEACCYFEKALSICRVVHGDFAETTAYSMIQLANAYQLAFRAQDAINLLEHAGMILSKLETQKLTVAGTKIREDDRKRITLQLNKLYLQLINLYMGLDRRQEADQLISQAEGRLEQCLEDLYTFKLMNELGNCLRKHDDLPTAVQLYKKSLLSIKIRCKNDYLQMRDTAKILINIASTEYMQDENVESLRYYQHALNVLKNCPDYPQREVAEFKRNSGGKEQPDFILRPEQVTLAVDLAKVHVSIGHLQKQFGELGKAHCHFKEAMDHLRACGDCGSGHPERMDILQEARKAMYEIGSSQ